MTAFSVPIKVDDGDSAARINKFESVLARAEDRSEQLGRACDRLSRNFGALGTIFERLGRAAELHAQQNNHLANGFERVAKAIDSERKMLSSIRGDIEAYARDVQVLNALMDRGKITAKEYDAALASAGKKHGVADAPKTGLAAGFLGEGGTGALAGIGGQLAAIAGPAALAAAGIDIVTDAIARAKQEARDMREATNSLLRYYDTAKEARAAVEPQKLAADALNVSLKEQIALYSSVRDAASNVSLTQKQLADITRNLGMTMIAEDRAIGDASAVLGQLQFSIDKGAISGGELSRIMKQFPPIASAWQKEFGKSTGELIKMADSGELTKEGLYRLLTALTDGSEAAKKFSERQLSIDDIMEKQNVSFVKAVEIWAHYRQAIEDAKKPVDELEQRLRDLDTQINKVAHSVDETGQKIDRALTKYFVDSFEAGQSKILGIVQKAHQAWEQSARDAIEWTKRINEEIAKLNKQEPPLRNVGHASGKSLFNAESVGPIGLDASWQEPIHQAMAYRATLDDIATRQQKYSAELASANDGIARGFNDIDKQIHDTASLTENLLVNGFHNFEDAIVQAALTGELSFSKMVDQIIADLARLAIRQLEAAALTAAIGGGGGGGGSPAAPFIDVGDFGKGLFGSAGFDVRIPHFAAGGGMRVPGTGATDRTFVPFWATGGERVIVQTQGQQMREREAAQAPAGPPQVNVINQVDPRALLKVVRTREFATELVNVIRDFPGLLKR